jgi:hypothetical protein
MDKDHLLQCPKLDYKHKELPKLYWDARRLMERIQDLPLDNNNNNNILSTLYVSSEDYYLSWQFLVNLNPVFESLHHVGLVCIDDVLWVLTITSFQQK